MNRFTSNGCVRCGIAAAALLTAVALLGSCGGSSESPPPAPQAPTFVVKGSPSRVQTAGWQPRLVERLLAAISPRPAQAQVMTAGSPTSLKLRLYALYLSPNPDCSAPLIVADYGTSPREVDMYTDPTLFEATPPNGTYPCLIIKFSDLIRMTPDAAAAAAFPGRCTAGVETTTDIYRAPSTDNRDPSGAPIVARGSRTAPVEDITYFFATTDVAAARGRPGGPGPNQTAPLAAPMVVPGRTTLYVDFTNGVLGGNELGVTYCVVEQGQIGFR
jgi:hypothetical protein